MAQVLAKEFKSIDNLAKKTAEELQEVFEIGPIVAQSIYNFFHDHKNLKVLEKMIKGGLQFPVHKEITKKTLITGKTFVLTGELESFSRDEAKRILESMGARVASSVSKNTDFVIVGESPGSKLANAQRMGVKTLNEEEFKKLVGK